MIYLALAAAAAVPSASLPPTQPSPDEVRFDQCVALVDSDAAKAAGFATAWQNAEGGIPARQCLGLALAAQGRWLPALAAFEQAAQAAERERDGRAPRLWIQAGNAALAANDPDRAVVMFNHALVGGNLVAAERGEAFLDMARAQVALKQTDLARGNLDAALKLVPQDPLAWLLSATLARRMNQLDRAGKDIAQAARLSPDDAQVALEAGNIAILSGAPEAAKTAWQAAARLNPDGPAGRAATEALKQFGIAPQANVPPVQPRPPVPAPHR